MKFLLLFTVALWVLTFVLVSAANHGRAAGDPVPALVMGAAAIICTAALVVSAILVTIWPGVL